MVLPYINLTVIFIQYICNVLIILYIMLYIDFISIIRYTGYMGDDNIDIDAKKILNDLYACRVVPISGGISDAANLTTSNIREPKERPELKYPKVFCYTCGNELHSEVYNMTWEDAVEMRHSCCCKEEKLVVYNEIIWNDKMPEVWTAFITDNPKIG